MQAGSGLFITRHTSIDWLTEWTGGMLQLVGCLCVRLHLAASEGLPVAVHVLDDLFACPLPLMDSHD